MGKNDRRGARKDRNRRFGTRVPDLGYYLIVTDTKETEKNYFEGLKENIPAELRDRLVIKVQRADVIDLVKTAKEFGDQDPQYRIPCIVFDRDQVKHFDQIIQSADKEGVKVGWSNPCIEIWFFAYFGEIPMIKDSVTCCTKFSDLYERRTGQKYKKANRDIYKKLIEFGDEEQAILRSSKKLTQLYKEGKSKPSEMWPGNTLFELISEINNKK